MEFEENVKHLFIYGILPEIIGKWYTRAPVADSSGVVSVADLADDNINNVDDNEDYDRLWCYCNQPSYGFMIECECVTCSIKWFHGDCLRIKTTPKGKWYCPSCRKLPSNLKQKRHKNRSYKQ